MSRRSLLRGIALAGGLAAFGGTLTACSSPTGAGGAGGAAGGTLTLALNRSLVSLDNKLNQFDAAVTVQRAVRQALTRIDEKLTPQLVLAEKFELTAPTQWTVKLRDNLAYSDGTPVKIDDVVTALTMYQQVNGSFLASFFPEWPKVVPVDDKTFTLETESPFPTLDYVMANILITPAGANQPQELQDGVGSGPYVVTAANRGTGEYTLKRNPKYWGIAAKIDTIEVRFMPEESSRVVALRSGQVDVIDSVSPDAVKQLAGLSDIKVETVDGTRLNQLFYNFRKPRSHPLANPQVRQALSHAINGPALIDNVLGGVVTAAAGPVPLTLAGAVKTGEYVYDPTKAKQMLDSLGVKNLEVKIIWESGEFANDASVMEAVAQMLGDVGVKATLQQFEPGGDILKWRQGRAGDWDILGNGFPSPTGLASTMMQGMYAGTAAKEATRDTYHGYVYPAITDLVVKAQSEVDRTARDKLLADAQKAIWDTWPCLWAFVPKAVTARRSQVEGIALTPANNYDVLNVRLGA
ncbi:ABC transporter substrate-binding protein [Plantactinospora mayteni]|uniref:ABC transporter substrate-binding protein n=1 Tax=Plantactinospora mayteni TaxID=566021 RepID=UPI001945068F|nr:ABC transporter substrate-binding protein [Plantactinospora mayteni]